MTNNAVLGNFYMARDRRQNSEHSYLRKEVELFHEKLDEFENKLDTLETQMVSLDGDFRKHEENERTLFDELLLAILKNTESARETATSVEEVKDSVKGYVELQEDISVVIRFIHKVGKVGMFVGKFAIVFGISGTALTYIYDWVIKHAGG